MNMNINKTPNSLIRRYYTLLLYRLLRLTFILNRTLHYYERPDDSKTVILSISFQTLNEREKEREKREKRGEIERER